MRSTLHYSQSVVQLRQRVEELVGLMRADLNGCNSFFQDPKLIPLMVLSEPLNLIYLYPFSNFFLRKYLSINHGPGNKFEKIYMLKMAGQ